MLKSLMSDNNNLKKSTIKKTRFTTKMKTLLSKYLSDPYFLIPEIKSELLKSQVLTEKSKRLTNTKNKNNITYKLVFDVDLQLNKLQIKNLLENLYPISIIAINTHRLPRKKKTALSRLGYQPNYKRVIIKIQNKNKTIQNKDETIQNKNPIKKLLFGN